MGKLGKWNRACGACVRVHMKRKPEQQIITKSNRKTNINRIVVFVMLNERIINVILFGHFPTARPTSPLPLPSPSPPPLPLPLQVQCNAKRVESNACGSAHISPFSLVPIVSRT